jgi:hypothetical protein
MKFWTSFGSLTYKVQAQIASEAVAPVNPQTNKVQLLPLLLVALNLRILLPGIFLIRI